MFTTILGAIAGLGVIFSTALYIIKMFRTTPEQQKEQIDKDGEAAKDSFEKTGRPS